MERLLAERYETPAVPGSFQGPQKVYISAKRDGVVTTKQEVENALQGQDSYTLNRAVIRKIPRNRVVVQGIDSQFDSDLADCALLSDKNDGYKYLLIMIDIFSRYAWVRPLKTKYAKEVVTAMQSIFMEGRKPAVLRTDGGREYNNKIVKTYLNSKGVHHFRTYNETKANYAERFIKTLKGKLYRYVVAKNTIRYIDILQDLVKSYNHTVHSSLGRPPSGVYKGNENEVRYDQYLRRRREKVKFQQFKFKPGDHVRISFTRSAFDREYNQRWSGEVYVIETRRRRDSIPIYTIKDWNGEKVDGTFYQQELQKVNVDDNNLFKIEKILKRRRRNGRRQVFVKWQNWNKSFNSWIDEDEVRE